MVQKPHFREILQERLGTNPRTHPTEENKIASFKERYTWKNLNFREIKP